MKKKHKLIIIDNDANRFNKLTNSLLKRYDLVNISDNKDIFNLAKIHKPSLIILDKKSLDLDGVSICEKIRLEEATKFIPIIIISSSSEPQNDQISYFKAGVDDYIEGPFRLKDLIARIDSKIRRLDDLSSKTEHVFISCGNMVIDQQKMEVVVGNQTIDLSVLELKIIKFFIDHKDEVLERDRILNSVWSAVVSPRSIDTHIVNLKKKLKKFNYSFYSVYGKGYILKKKKQKTK